MNTLLLLHAGGDSVFAPLHVKYLNMKRTLLLALLLVPLLAVAQSRIYKGSSTYSSDILYTFDGKYLYRGSSTYRSDILYTVSGRVPIAVIVALL